MVFKAYLDTASGGLLSSTVWRKAREFIDLIKGMKISLDDLYVEAVSGLAIRLNTSEYVQPLSDVRLDDPLCGEKMPLDGRPVALASTEPP